MHNQLREVVEQIGSPLGGAKWSIAVRDQSGSVIAELAATARCATASIGKVLLLIEAARQILSGRLASDELLMRSPELAVQDSGIWQHLQVDSLSVHDCICLIAATSDNLATNVLLKRVGLPAVSATTHQLGLHDTELCDYVRTFRTTDHPPALSVGSASELSLLMHRLAVGDVLDATVSKQVLSWLALNTDVSMVASAFGFDPLAHVEPDRKLSLFNKTGTNDGVRADVGVIKKASVHISYAVLAQWNRQDSDDSLRMGVLDHMHAIGVAIARELPG